MFTRLFLLFVLVPLADLILLLLIARIHWLISVALIIVTALVGAWLLRRQGTSVCRALRNSMLEGQIPTQPLMDGSMILLAAGLLLTPGVITDLFGITFLIPACRRWYRQWIKRWFSKRMEIHAYGFGQSVDESTVEGNFVRKPSTGKPDSQILDDPLIEQDVGKPN